MQRFECTDMFVYGVGGHYWAHLDILRRFKRHWLAYWTATALWVYWIILEAGAYGNRASSILVSRF
jgi:hypothetical protein